MPIGGASQEAWFRAVNHLARATPWLHTPARLFAQDGIVLFAALLLLSWWWARRSGDPRRVAAALWAPAGALVALGANQLLVAAFAEPRPFTVVPDALVLVSRSTDASFPSDHAVMAGAVAMGLALAHGRHALAWTGAGLAVLMAATRVYVGAHFPLDVVAGLLVGAAIALASYRLVRPVAVRLVEAVARTPVRALVRG
ncbi:phosphatase PAP2 family protein [Nocardioides sp. WV_118_6]